MLGVGVPSGWPTPGYCLTPQRRAFFFLRKRFASAILQECVAGKMKEKRKKGKNEGPPRLSGSETSQVIAK